MKLQKLHYNYLVIQKPFEKDKLALGNSILAMNIKIYLKKKMREYLIKLGYEKDNQW